MKKTFILMLLGLMLLSFNRGVYAEDIEIAIGAKFMPSTTYILAVALSQTINDFGGDNLNTHVSSFATDGVFPHEFTNGKIQLAIGASPTSIQGALSMGTYKNKKPAPMKIISTGPIWYQGLVARSDAHIDTPADLKGKKWFGIRKGSVLVNQMNEAIMYAYNLTPKDVRVLEYSTTNELLEGLKSGRVDAGSFPYSSGTPWVEELATLDLLNLVSDNPENLEKILAKYPFFTRVTLPANTYRGQNKEVVTFGSLVTIDVSSDLSEEIVYNITSALYDNYDEWVKGHEQIKEFALPQAIELDRMVLPIHEGAVKYYKEKGYWTLKHADKQQILLEEWQKARN